MGRNVSKANVSDMERHPDNQPVAGARCLRPSSTSWGPPASRRASSARTRPHATCYAPRGLEARIGHIGGRPTVADAVDEFQHGPGIAASPMPAKRQ